MLPDRRMYYLPWFAYLVLKIYFARVYFTFCLVVSVYVLYGSALFVLLFYVSNI